MSDTDIVITSAARTPVGAFNGSFANTPAHELGTQAIKAALERSKVEAKDVSEVILGQVLTAGQGQNPPRQASMAAGVPDAVPAWNVQYGLWFGVAGCCTWFSGNREWGFQNCRRGRSGEHVAVAAYHAPSRRYENG